MVKLVILFTQPTFTLFQKACLISPASSSIAESLYSFMAPGKYNS